MSKFEQEYKRLNPQQKKAVDAIEGPVMVVAGPGTGKTQILTLRVANILKKTDIGPSAILALTFTESGVASMRRRLVEMIGASAYSVVINTFHGFCRSVIEENPEEFPEIIAEQNISEVDQIDVIEEALKELPLKEMRIFSDTSRFAGSILNAIKNLKREGISPDDFKKITDKEADKFEKVEDLYHEKGAWKGQMRGDYQKLQKQIAKNRELVKIYKFYEEQLAINQLYDYEDMIMKVLKRLKENKDLLLISQEKHQYILVDEHQDTNNAQNKIMELLCNFHKNPNIFVVGDEKQAIFRFQGASLENFMYFKKLYPKAKLIVLEENYRSTQTILDSAHSILAGKKELRAKAGHKEKKISLYSFSKPEVETYFVAKDIEKKIASGVKPEEIAVLYRDNKDAIPYISMFEKIGLPFVIESEQDIKSDNEIRKLISLMRATGDFGNQEILIEAMHIDFLGIEPLDIYKLIETAKEKKISVFDIAKNKKRMGELKLESVDKIHDFYFKLSGWATIQKNQGLADFFELLVRESGFLAHILKRPDAVGKLDKLNALFDEIKNMVAVHRDYRLADFIKYLDTLEAHDLLIRKSSSGIPANQIRLMTAHKSKGQEFQYVYIVNAYDGHWGNKKKPEYLKLPLAVFSVSGRELEAEDRNSDERRLFYVAITRAKKEVAISYARENQTKKDLLPCLFVQEIKLELLEKCNSEKYEKDFNSKREIIFAPRKYSGADIKSKEYIAKLFSERGFAPTHLNNYLECPWKYFYMNLFRIPKPPEKHFMFGNAIHYSLKDFFNALKDGRGSRKFLLDKFNFYLKRQPFTEKEFKTWQERGENDLAGYFDNYSGKWRLQTINEMPINAVMLGDIRLTGKIDKIEFLGNGNEVNVVDYKTGEPKTRGEIEGTTKNSNGDIKRQLVFYNLLLNASKPKYRMVSADVDFIEPDEKGRYRKESFVINPEKIKELEEIIKKVSNEILNVKFWDKRCDNKDCEFCALREMMI